MPAGADDNSLAVALRTVAAATEAGRDSLSVAAALRTVDADLKADRRTGSSVATEAADIARSNRAAGQVS